MTTSWIIFFAGLAGLGLGAIFFGGLWWTIRRGVSSPRPAAWFLGSAILRMGIALLGFYFVGGGEWPRLVACLAGFLAARFTITWLTRPTGKISADANQETSYAP
ncbi:MAG: ATP synthase subunit I [Opitutaceae bacterium]